VTDRVALFRGINVGGRNSLPMRELRALLEDIGCAQVRTYIQSGNTVFRCADDTISLADRIRRSVEERFGFAPHVLVLEAERFRMIAGANPFPDAIDDPKGLHVWFLAGAPDAPDTDTLESLCTPSERFRLTDSAMYLHAPDGIGRSRFASRAERCLGVPATARNWRTVSKLLELLDA